MAEISTDIARKLLRSLRKRNLSVVTELLNHLEALKTTLADVLTVQRNSVTPTSCNDLLREWVILAINHLAHSIDRSDPFKERHIAFLRGYYLHAQSRTQIQTELHVRGGNAFDVMDQKAITAFTQAFNWVLANQNINQSKSTQVALLQNLPFKTYAQLIGRNAELKEVLNWLRADTKTAPTVLLISGLGGNGKTSLAREAIEQIIRHDKSQPYDQILWVSNPTQSGLPPLAKKPSPEHALAVSTASIIELLFSQLNTSLPLSYTNQQNPRLLLGQAFTEQRCLIVLDGTEVFEDEIGVVAALLSIPGCQRVLLTSRTTQLALLPNCLHIPIAGLSPSATHKLMTTHVNHPAWSSKQITQLHTLTGGAPLAIRFAHTLSSVWANEQLIDQLHQANGVSERLYEYIFGTEWRGLSQDAKRLMVFLARWAIAPIAFEHLQRADLTTQLVAIGVQELIDTHLIEVDGQISATQRIHLHPLARNYAQRALCAKDIACDHGIPFEQECTIKATQLWIGLFAEQPAIVDRHSTRQNILMAAEQAANVGDWKLLRQFWMLTQRIYDLGAWHDYERLERICLLAAQALNDATWQADICSELAWIFSAQLRHAEATQMLDAAETLYESLNISIAHSTENPSLLPSKLLRIKRYRANQLLISGDYAHAHHAFSLLLNQVDLLLLNNSFTNDQQHNLKFQRYVIIESIGIAFRELNELDAAEHTLHQALHQAQMFGPFQIATCQLNLAKLKIKQRQFDRARAYLDQSLAGYTQLHSQQYLQYAQEVQAQLNRLTSSTAVQPNVSLAINK